MPALIRDFALDVANRVAPSHHFALSLQASLPHGTEEIDIQLNRREGFAARDTTARPSAISFASNPMSRATGTSFESEGTVNPP